MWQLRTGDQLVGRYQRAGDPLGWEKEIIARYMTEAEAEADESPEADSVEGTYENFDAEPGEAERRTLLVDWNATAAARRPKPNPANARFAPPPTAAPRARRRKRTASASSTLKPPISPTPSVICAAWSPTTPTSAPATPPPAGPAS